MPRLQGHGRRFLIEGFRLRALGLKRSAMVWYKGFVQGFYGVIIGGFRA